MKVIAGLNYSFCKQVESVALFCLYTKSFKRPAKYRDVFTPFNRSCLAFMLNRHLVLFRNYMTEVKREKDNSDNLC